MVRHRFLRGKHYVVCADQVEMIDEGSRLLSSQPAGSAGVRQAIEAQEGRPLTPRSTSVARMTIQDFVAQFRHLCGLTSTAWGDRREWNRVYGLNVRRMPTSRPIRRQVLPTIACLDQTEKLQRIVAEVRDVIAADRAVLIGTRSAAETSSLRQVFQQHGVTCQTLDDKDPVADAELMADAGHSGRVTISTNMAGMATEICLSPAVRDAGGLHVIVSEPFPSARLDRQLITRAGEQGAPGTARAYVSGDDTILKLAYGSQRAEEIRHEFVRSRSERRLLARLRRAQLVLASNDRRRRKHLTAYHSRLANSMQAMGLDPYLDPLPDLGP